MLHTKADVNQVVLNVLYNKQTGILLSELQILLEGGNHQNKAGKQVSKNVHTRCITCFEPGNKQYCKALF